MSFNWWTLLLQVINFLILVWLLRRFLYKPVQAVLERRRALAEQALADASEKRKEAEAEKAALEEARAALEAQRQGLIEAAEKEAEAKRKAIVAEAGKQGDALLARSRAEAEKAREADIGSLKAELAGAAANIARTILAGTMDEGLDAVFRERILKKLDGLLRERPLTAAEKNAALAIVTAAPLADGDEAAWRVALKARGLDAASIAFSTDESLLAGAELRLPRGDLRFAWADQLKEAEALLDAPRAAE